MLSGLPSTVYKGELKEDKQVCGKYCICAKTDESNACHLKFHTSVCCRFQFCNCFEFILCIFVGMCVCVCVITFEIVPAGLPPLVKG